MYLNYTTNSFFIFNMTCFKYISNKCLHQNRIVNNIFQNHNIFIN